MSKRLDATAGLYELPVGDTVLTWLVDVSTGAADETLTATAADLTTDGATLLLGTCFHLYAIDIADPRAPGAPVDVPFALELQGEGRDAQCHSDSRKTGPRIDLFQSHALDLDDIDIGLGVGAQSDGGGTAPFRG